MALGSCEHCGQVLREEDYDAHQTTHHPDWAVQLVAAMTRLNDKLERIASALEGLEKK